MRCRLGSCVTVLLRKVLKIVTFVGKVPDAVVVWEVSGYASGSSGTLKSGVERSTFCPGQGIVAAAYG